MGVVRDRSEGERRVALVPDTVEKLTARGITILVESGAGCGAYFDDDAFRASGARIEERGDAIYRDADIIARIGPIPVEDISSLRPGTFLISLLEPVRDANIVSRLQEQNVTAFSFNAVPRVTRAQSMDVLSSMATVAGYKAVLLAATSLGRFFPLLMTAAGTVAPARVVVIGAGVAGLQALATARRLGAVTAACDARAAVREQVQSVGASFIDMMAAVPDAEGEGGYARVIGEELLRLERDAIRDHITAADVVICTAQVPGARAPLLVDEAMVSAMRAGSAIVDLAAEAGGNCELTVPGETVVRCGVEIHGPINLASTVPVHASQMFSRNVESVITLVVKDGQLVLDFEDEILRAACLAKASQPAMT